MAAAAARKPSKKRPPSATPIGRLTLLVENMQGDMRRMADGIALIMNRLDGMATKEQVMRLEKRIELLEQVVREHSSEIRSLKAAVLELADRVGGLERRMDGVDGRLKHVEEEARAVRALLEERRDRDDPERVAALDRRVSVIEAQLGITPGR